MGSSRARSTRSWVGAAAACWLLLAATTGVATATSATTATTGARRGVAASDDTLFAQQWNLTQIGAAEAWGTSTGAGVKIGIVDTGIDAGHPDLAGRVESQADCTGGPCREGRATDVDGHGTSVAGVAAASFNNGTGIAGVAPEARLVVAKVLGDDGTGRIEDINSGIRWVVDHGAKVVSLSLGDPAAIRARAGNTLESGIQYAWTRGAIPVLAAGNFNTGVLGTGSAGYGNLNAIVVGATDRKGGVAFYSSPLGNAKWGIVAPGGNSKGPGEDILSTEPGGGYGWSAGTSLAVPHVSGAVALVLAQGLGQQATVDRLLATLDTSHSCGDGCRGLLKVDAAVKAGAAGSPSSSVPDGSATGPGDSGGSSSPPVVVIVLGIVVVAGAAAAIGIGVRSARR